MRLNDVSDWMERVGPRIELQVGYILTQARLEAGLLGFKRFDPAHALLIVLKSGAEQLRKKLHLALSSSSMEGEHEALWRLMLDKRDTLPSSEMMISDMAAARMFRLMIRIVNNTPTELNRQDLLVIIFASRSPFIEAYLHQIGRTAEQVLEALDAPDWLIIEVVEAGMPSP